MSRRLSVNRLIPVNEYYTFPTTHCFFLRGSITASANFLLCWLIWNPGQFVLTKNCVVYVLKTSLLISDKHAVQCPKKRNFHFCNNNKSTQTRQHCLPPEKNLQKAWGCSGEGKCAPVPYQVCEQWQQHQRDYPEVPQGGSHHVTMTFAYVLHD